MAKILPSAQNFRQTQEAFLKQSLSEYSNFLNSIPLLVTYYSKDHLKSTHDVNLHTVQEILGGDSPVKFNKINDFPLYKASNLEGAGEDNEDVGTEANIEGTAIIPPQSMMPRVDDLFTIPWYGKQAIFRIKNVRRSNLKGRTFYEISYYLYSTMGQLGDLQKQVSEEYRLVGSTTSATKSAIVAVDKADLCDFLQLKIESFIDTLWAFYDPSCEAYVYKESYDIYRWDEIVHSFVIDTNAFSRAIPFRNDVILNFIDPVEIPDMYATYKKTIYYAIKTQDFSFFGNMGKSFMVGGSWSELEPGKFLRGVTVKPCRYTSGNSGISYGLVNIEGNLKEYLDDDTDQVKPSIAEAASYMELIKFYKDDRNLDNVKDVVNKIIPEQGRYDYYYLPIAIYILRQILISIKSTYDFNN